MLALVLLCRLLLLPNALAGDDGDATDPTTQSTDDRAKELYENGADLYDEGRYEDAVAAWEESFRLSNRPLLLYNIANAEERAGHYDLALDRLNRYRAFATAGEREILDRRIRSLGQRIDQQKAAGAPSTSTGTTGTTGTEPAPTTVTTTAPATPAPDSTAKVERSGPTLPTYILGGVGLVGIGSGVYFGLQATAARTEAGALCQEAGDKTTFCSADAKDALKRDKLDSLLTDISLGVGGAALIGAGVAALLDAPVSFVPLGDGAMVTFGGKY